MADLVKTHVFVILDRSGSMSSVSDATIKGYNDYLKQLRKEAKAEVSWSLTLFDDRIEEPVVNTPVNDVPLLNNKTFVPRGSTALIDAVCRTLKDRQSDVKKGEKGIVVIITDGYENASREYSSEQLRDMIAKLEAKKNWTLTYLGANQDAWETAKSFGIQRGNANTYAATERGTTTAFAAMSVSTSGLANSGQMRSANFYNDGKTKTVLGGDNVQAKS